MLLERVLVGVRFQVILSRPLDVFLVRGGVPRPRRLIRGFPSDVIRMQVVLFSRFVPSKRGLNSHRSALQFVLPFAHQLTSINRLHFFGRRVVFLQKLKLSLRQLHASDRLHLDDGVFRFLISFLFDRHSEQRLHFSNGVSLLLKLFALFSTFERRSHSRLNH